MKKLNKNDNPTVIKGEPLYLYGAGYTARICLNALKNSGFKVEALIDDDVMKQGTIIDSYLVLSYQEFVKKCEDEKSIHVILTSIYGKQIYNRVSCLPNVTIWEMYEWYMNILDQQGLACEKCCEDKLLEEYKKNTDELKKYLADMESKNVYDAIYQYFKTNEISYLVDICTEEESYFTKEVKRYFQNKDLVLVDAGAYEGELLRSITASGLKVKEWYCFELERNNFERLKNNVERSILPDGMTCIVENYGLWNAKKDMSVLNLGTASKVSALLQDSGNTDEQEICKMNTIDEYFKNISIDMIKMDIEGAEMQALEGGINTIKRDRPLLAISIYHYVKDYYRIMQFLMDNLDGYLYYIRQHAMIYGETILYAIPD